MAGRGPLSLPSAKSGEGITRGLTIAIDEINAKGVCSAAVFLNSSAADDESNQAKGQTRCAVVIDKEGSPFSMVASISPCHWRIVPLVIRRRLPFMGVWASRDKLTATAASKLRLTVSAVDVLVDRAFDQRRHDKSRREEAG